MDLQKIHARLDRLRTDRNEWGTMGSRQRLNAKLGEVLITIDNNPVGSTYWQVTEPKQEKVVQAWTPANGIPDAMRESTDFTRAYLNITADQHLVEN